MPVKSREFDLPRTVRIAAFAVLMVLTGLRPSLAVDPLYQPQMQRLVTIMGSLYFLDPMCSHVDRFWRYQAEDLINLDQPDDDRRQRLYGAFNQGYEDYARTYATCTPAARMALDTLLDEAEALTEEIHSRFAE